MPQADVRASGLDILARTGSPLTITLTWPTGYLTGKTFTASVGGTAITPAIASDVMTLSLTGAQTTALGNGRHALLVTDTTGDDVVRIAGRVLLGTSSTDSPDASVTVLTDTNVEVDVTVAVGLGLPLPSGTASVGRVPAVTDDDPLTLAWTDIGTQVELDAEAAARIAGDAASVSTAATDATTKANAAQAAAIQRANHTGTQTASTISDFATAAVTAGNGTFVTVAGASEVIDDRVATLLVAGTNITLTYNDAAGTLTIDAAGGGGGLTQEQAEDIVAALIDDSSDLDWTYDDGTGSLVAVIKPGSVTNAMLAGSIDQSKVTNLTSDLAAKAPSANPTFTGTVTIPDGALAIADTNGLQTALDAKAPLASPALTGTPTAPTPSAGDGSTKVATTEYVDDADGGLTTLITAKQASIAQQTAAPSSPATGDLWIDTDAPGLVIGEAHADAGTHTSSAEQTLATFTLPGGLIVVGDVLRFTAMGDLLNNIGSAVTYTWRFKIGTTTVLVTSALSIATNANRLTWKLDGDIHFPTTASERACVSIIASGQGAAQWKTVAIAATVSVVGYGTASEDTATDKAVSLTCQMNTSNANADVVCHAASLTHLHV